MIHLTATLPNNLFTLPSYYIVRDWISRAFSLQVPCWVDYINEEQLSDKFGRPQTANLQFLLLTRPFSSESHISCLCESPTGWCALSFLLFGHVICFQWQSQCNVGLWFGFLWWTKVLLQFVVFVIGPVVGWILMQNSWLQKSTGQIFAIFLITNFSGSATWTLNFVSIPARRGALSVVVDLGKTLFDYKLP